MISRKLGLELANRVIDYNCLLNHTACILYKRLVDGVRLDVVVPVLFGLEVDSKSMRYPVLRPPLACLRGTAFERRL